MMSKEDPDSPGWALGLSQIPTGSHNFGSFYPFTLVDIQASRQETIRATS